MKDRKTDIKITLPVTALFFLALLISSAFAAHQEFEKIEELDAMEKRIGKPSPPEAAITRPKVEYRAQNLRDPFESGIQKSKPGKSEVSAQESPLPLFDIQGLIWGGSLPQAIINNTVVKVGDTIQGAKIISIKKEGVSVFFEGRQYDLPPPSEVSPESKGGQDEEKRMW